MSIRISAVIPTFNRAAYLREAIQSLIQQTLPREQYEILVVDNCSTDETKQVVASEFADVPNLRYLYDPILGLNHARNTGWQQSRGVYVAYTDDDAVVASDWLEKTVLTFDAIIPRAGCVGGRVIPIWEVPRPAWLPEELVVLYTVTNIPSAKVLTKGESLLGANIAFRKSTLEAVGAFLPGLDRNGNKLLSNGEVLLQIELDRSGVPRFYNPDVIVHHHIPASRLTQAWLLKRMYWQGVSEALLEVQRDRLTKCQRLRLGFHRLRRFMVRRDLLRALVIRTDTAERIRPKCYAFSKWGNILGLLGISK